MSTRSGKRIHKSFHEDTANPDLELIVRSERKTRSKCLKENSDEVKVTLFKTKKRSNYVSYPTDDELLGEAGIINDDESKSNRVLRINTLKEHNINTQTTEKEELFTDTKKLVRTTRRTRKFSENATEDTQDKYPSIVERPKAKKIKKKKSNTQASVESVPKKKSKNKKRERRSSSMVVEEIEPEETFAKNFNKSNMSVDSSHSAAGSPEMRHEEVQNILDASEEEPEYNTNIVNRTFENIYDKTLINSVKKSKERKSFIKDRISDNSLSESTDSIIYQNMNPFSEEDRPKRTSSIKDITLEVTEIEPLNNTFTKESNKKKSSLKDTTYEKDPLIAMAKNNDKTIEKDSDMIKSSFDSSNTRSKRKSAMYNVTEKHNSRDQEINRTFEKDCNSITDSINRGTKRKSSDDENVVSASNIINTTFEKDNEISNSEFETVDITSNKRKSIIDTTFEKDAEQNDTTFVSQNNGLYERKSAMKDTTFKKDSISVDSSISNATCETKKRKSLRKLSYNFEMNTTFDKDEKLDTTFDKSNSKSSLISSDNTNLTLDKSDTSHISITSDDSRENIVNTTPVLIESSMDESQINSTSKNDHKLNEIIPPLTLLKREGTFTKDGPDVIIMSPKTTPTKRMSLPSPGCTPFHVTKSEQKEKSLLNVTRSVEKGRRSSLAEVVPRTTKVMFCSPVNDPMVETRQMKKVIKSNLKGSNKSFIFDDSAARGAGAGAGAGGRKRSLTHCGAEQSRVKRKRLADELQLSVARLARPRTLSAAAKLTEPSTPSKRLGTPSKAKPDAKVARTKLPNFAALHQRHFEKMESLDECQERKAKRAKQLLTPTGAVSMLERISPKGMATEPQKSVKGTEKTETPIKSLPNSESQKPGYTRFGFKLNLDVNPFSIPSKNTDVKPKESKPNVLTRQGTLPSLAGATSVRRETAKQTVMREKSFTERRNYKRNENRTIIKGVRTNRRFELQMQLRNLE